MATPCWRPLTRARLAGCFSCSSDQEISCSSGPSVSSWKHSQWFAMLKIWKPLQPQESRWVYWESNWWLCSRKGHLSGGLDSALNMFGTQSPQRFFRTTTEFGQKYPYCNICNKNIANYCKRFFCPKNGKPLPWLWATLALTRSRSCRRGPTRSCRWCRLQVRVCLGKCCYCFTPSGAAKWMQCCHAYSLTMILLDNDIASDAGDTSTNTHCTLHTFWIGMDMNGQNWSTRRNTC